MPLPMPDSRLRAQLAAAAAGAGAAAISVRALARPRPASADRRLLDWEVVRRVAHQRSGESGSGALGAEGPRLGAAYDAMARQLAPHMAEVCQSAVAGFPQFIALDRRGFIDRNLVIVRRIFEPIEELRASLPESRATQLGRRVLSRYVGELFGFLSRRVLGQYDPVLTVSTEGSTPAPPDATSLYLVEPNVVAFERRHGVGAQSVRRWLVLHELTHAWQFESHPWLREHIGGIMRELLLNDMMVRLSQAEAEPATGSDHPPQSLTSLLGGLPKMLGSQLRAVGRVQAVMSVAEGYSNYVMHQVGRRHLADFESLERAFHRRSSERPAWERVVMAVTGLSMKMRQYELGERFAERVVEIGGLDMLNRVWEGPARMPSLDELSHPTRWVSRVSDLPVAV